MACDVIGEWKRLAMSAWYKASSPVRLYAKLGVPGWALWRRIQVKVGLSSGANIGVLVLLQTKKQNFVRIFVHPHIGRTVFGVLEHRAPPPASSRVAYGFAIVLFFVSATLRSHGVHRNPYVRVHKKPHEDC